MIIKMAQNREIVVTKKFREQLRTEIRNQEQINRFTRPQTTFGSH